MSEQDAALDLSEAEAALERGDYGQGLELLLPWQSNTRSIARKGRAFGS